MLHHPKYCVESRPCLRTCPSTFPHITLEQKAIHHNLKGSATKASYCFYVEVALATVLGLRSTVGVLYSWIHGI